MISPYLWILSFGHLIVDLVQGVLPILMPLLAQSFHLSYFQVGTITLAFTFSSAIIQPVFGVLSDRYSMPWLMPLGLFLSGFGLALIGIVNSYGLLLLAVLLSGIGVAGYHPEGSKMAHFASEDTKAGSSMAVFSVGGNLGFGLGPILAMFVLSFAGLDSIQSVMIPGALAAVIFLFLLPRFKKILARKSHMQKKDQEQTVSSVNRVGSLILLILYVTIRSWIQSGLVYFIPFYFPSFKGIAEPVYLVSIFLLAGVVGTILGGPFADRFGGRNGLLASMIISLITIYPFLHLNGTWIPVLSFIIGASLISTFSTTVVFGQRLLPHNIGLASGLMLGFGIGMGSIGVTILGAIADHVGMPFTMDIISLLPVLGIILAFTLPDVRSRGFITKPGNALQQQA
ncbi:MFS transporter [Desulfosporosinus sp. BICA1-9]|uniref:MFS transporter n=1 Tax=Desulfosporosinus sp. BICA1-9 TaxID=1531958 RepID=UPI00054B991C|nr:MFS transporter [Desulfosporosinus sp. BICA1-9]KJS49681.1 MAG: sugar phosphate permease [Peptococcaceae bacterium BRH_c23]KJS77833.1 MAG: sugar phosphate permease [Desulfosporosinus sp. BICA1-9]HBW38510.1 MFS transporter [Desulfosporosinus sp.]